MIPTTCVLWMPELASSVKSRDSTQIGAGMRARQMRRGGQHFDVTVVISVALGLLQRLRARHVRDRRTRQSVALSLRLVRIV